MHYIKGRHFSVNHYTSDCAAVLKDMQPQACTAGHNVIRKGTQLTDKKKKIVGTLWALHYHCKAPFKKKTLIPDSIIQDFFFSQKRSCIRKCAGRRAEIEKDSMEAQKAQKWPHQNVVPETNYQEVKDYLERPILLAVFSIGDFTFRAITFKAHPLAEPV